LNAHTSSFPIRSHPPHFCRLAMIVLGLFVFSGLALTIVGCGRPIKRAELPLMSFASQHPPIDGAITVCLTPDLRRRSWNVRDHPFRVGLGERASINFEHMVKAAFREVATNLEEDCGKPPAQPRIEARIDLANRELDSEADRDQVTVITMSFELYGADNRLVWRETTRGEVIAKRAGFGSRARHRVAARHLGDAMGKAIDLAYFALIESEEVREAFGDTALLDLDVEAASDHGTES
jgi:hypothetical protein